MSLNPSRRRALRDEWRASASGGCLSCSYCARPIQVAHLTIDHVNSLFNGGKSNTANLAPCCKRCNTKKGSRSGAQFRVWMQTMAGVVWLDSMRRRR